jgi:aromatic ring-cleaving dioxygenase
MSVVVCKLPQAGLGNWLFCLMKAKVFAEMYQLPLIIIGYHQLKIGPYLRFEKNKRKYGSFFTFQKNIFGEFLDSLMLFRYKNYLKIYEPRLVENDFYDFQKKQIYLFSEVPHWANYFDGLKQNRQLVKALFCKNLNTSVKTIVSDAQVPAIGVHIRMGDYRKLKEGEDFAILGSVRTPETYFNSVIEQIRYIHNENLAVTVFTDGYENELPLLFKMPNVKLSKQNPDIVDLILLSKSKLIITSAGSTFSYWAAFLSEAVIIMHPDHIHQRIRNELHLFEGTITQYVNYFKKD